MERGDGRSGCEPIVFSSKAGKPTATPFRRGPISYQLLVEPFAAEPRFKVLHAVKHSQDVDAVRSRAVEDQDPVEWFDETEHANGSELRRPQATAPAHIGLSGEE